MLAIFLVLFYGQAFLLGESLQQTDAQCTGNLGLDWYLPASMKLPDDRITASSQQAYRLAKYGRMRHPVQGKNFGVWCAEQKDKHPWFQVDFMTMKSVTQVAIGSSEWTDGFVKTYSLRYSYDGVAWYVVKENLSNKTKIFQGCEDQYVERSKVGLDTAITAQYFRIYPEDVSINSCLKAEFYGCTPQKNCNKAIGITNNAIIPDNAITSSTFYKNHPPKSGRLNATMKAAQGQWGAWCAAAGDSNPWLQIDLKLVRELSKLETQGHPFGSMSSWVTKYAMNYSLNGIDWSTYDNHKVFRGNIDNDSKKINTLAAPIMARFIRFLPKLWVGDLPCLRVEAYECVPRKESIPELVHGISDTTIKRGEPLTKECVFRGQPNITIVWNINDKYLPTDERISTSEVTTVNEARSTLHFKRIKEEEDGAIFTCRAWYPRLQKVNARSTATINVLAPIPSLTVVKISKTFSHVYLNHTGPLTIDVVGYRVRVKSVDGVIDKNIPVNHSSLVVISELRPFNVYQFDVAMMYIENEVGQFYSKKEIKTPQDKPYGAPLNLHVTKVFHDTLRVTWKEPDPKLRNGPITFHNVRYLKSDKNDDVTTRGVAMIRKTLNTTVSLTNLEPGAIYEVSVRSWTKVGPGPWVHPPLLMFTGKATEELNSIKKMVITDANAAAVSYRLKNITADPNFLNKHDVVLTLDILEKVVHQRNTSDEIGKSLVEAVSNVLKANKTVLSESEITNRTGTRYVKMLEKWLEGVDSRDKKLEEESENVIVKKVYINKLKLEEGIKFAEKDNDNSVQITIPKEALPENSTADSIYFVFYKKNKFFSSKKRLEELCIDGFTVIKERVYTPVVSGEVIGQRTRNLSAPVVLKFKHNEDAIKLKDTACAYWDYEADNEKGGWSTEGCKLESIVNQTITCHCNHLTNFAAMMDVYAQTSTICGKHQKIISFITVIGCFMSLIGLFLTFLTYFIFRRLLKEMAAKVLIQLCVALFIVILTFVTGVEQTDKPMMCMTVAFVLHYFTLVSFFWMLMEALFMYHAFVRVWPPRQGGDIYRSTIIAWGMPLFIVGITFLTSMDSYGGKHYCHLTGTPLIISYLAPIGLIILINLAIFVFIMKKLSARPDSNTDQNNLQIASARLRRAFGIMILMGLTWAFGFGSVTNARLEFSYLFSIFNASQGFAIFIFYCVAQKRARAEWYAFFTCDGRTENKRNTDSYFSERRRMSSIASNRTNTMQFNRLGSNASSVLASSGSVVSPERYSSPMNTIEEVESPIRTFDEPPEYPLIILAEEKETSLLELDQLDNTDGGSYEEEDELLNKQLQESEDNRQIKPADIKQYSSYRALSGSKSYDVLNLVKTPSGRNIENKNADQRRSTEIIFRKDSQGSAKVKSNNNRRSLVDTSTNRISSPPHAKSIRTVKSMEHINKKELCESQIPSAIDSEIDLTSYKKVDTNRRNTLGQQDDSKTVAPKNTQINNDERPSSIDTGTLKSDAATMTDDVAPPPYDSKALRLSDHKSKGDIIEWLDHCVDDVDEESAIKDSDSDYSSSFYKTSRSSSMTDVVAPSHTSGERHNGPSYLDEPNRRSAEKQLLDNMILGPLKGNNLKNNNRNYNKNKQSNSTAPSEDDEKFSDFSEDGYSASEEDIFENNKQQKNINKPPSSARRKKPRTRSVTTLMKPSGYLKIDDPSSQSSYV